jgi:hypothetical protein
MNDFVTIVNEPNFYVGWFTLVLINTNIAQCKGLSGMLWFILSLLLGPFATGILVLMGSKRNRMFS